MFPIHHTYQDDNGDIVCPFCPYRIRIDERGLTVFDSGDPEARHEGEGRMEMGAPVVQQDEPLPDEFEDLINKLEGG